MAEFAHALRRMTYCRILRYFLGITTLVFIGLWVASKGRCPEVFATTPHLRLECMVVNGTVDINLHWIPDGGGRYRLLFFADPETRFRSDMGWGRWMKRRTTIYKDGSYMVDDGSPPEEGDGRQAGLRTSAPPASLAVTLVMHKILFPLWLPYLLIVVSALLLHWWLNGRVASRQRALVAGLGEGSPV